MESIALHLLDIVENSIDAKASRIEIEISRDEKQTLYITITDNGKGMTSEELEKACNPFYTSRTTRKVGIGLSLLKQHVEETEGFLKIESEKNVGTKISFAFNLWHIDCVPLGDLDDVLSTLIAVNPSICFFITIKFDNKVFSIDSKSIYEIFKDIPVSQNDIKNMTQQLIKENIEGLDIKKLKIQ
jgi:hypothetical protein